MSVQKVIRDYPLEPAVQLISHLSEGAYTSFPKVIKELVNNSFDARAARVDINFMDGFSVLEIRDNGAGVSSDEFKSEFLRISGSKRRLGGNIDPITNRPIIGRLGIGVLAIAPVCEYADIISKREGEASAIHRRVPLKHLFESKIQSENLGDHFYFERLSDIQDEADKHYTEIRLINLRDDIKKELQIKRPLPSKGWKTISQLDGLNTFKWRLALLIPIEYEENLPVYGIPSKVIEKAVNELRSFDFKVYVNDEELRKPVCLRSHFFKDSAWNYDDEVVPKVECDILELISQEDEPVQYWGYIYDQTKQIFPSDLRGILIRINHVGIKGYSKSLFEFTKNIGPTLFSVSGEIFIGYGLEEALTMDKDDFKEEHPDFRHLVRKIHEAVEEIRQNARERSARLKGKARKHERRLAKDLRTDTPVLKEVRDSIGSRRWKEVIPVRAEQPISVLIGNLTNEIEELSNVGISTEEQEYLLEALRCLQTDCFRGAIVLMWNAAMYRIHLKISQIGFDNFSNAVTDIVKRKIFPWVKDSPPHVADVDEFRLKVRDTTTCAGIYGLKLIDLPTTQALHSLLQIRHNCAHPTGYDPTDGEAFGCFTFLLKNIFENHNLVGQK
jgi:hypothetical protein